jgi:topoisomerase-4 subunit A
MDVSEDNTEEVDPSENIEESKGERKKTTHLSGMYENWFLDYASYVILERAVPYIKDGLKPVQRRLLHAMKELDDGRYNKVANIIGHTMKYHPHGDVSIGDALVQLGQKDLLIDTQGNWGNILTGDTAAAPRYIEARLSKFAQEVVFSPKTTHWKTSYDGRNKEPVAFPVKFPLLLAQGVEGIAVGLASKILPHNFNELIDASISYLEGKETELFPDFITGGQADFSKYNDGLRGGKVRIRAKITQVDRKELVITEVPFSTTTGSLIESIIVANDKGKIKIRKIEDNTAENVEIRIYLNPGVSTDTTIDALYAFTDCEISISPNSCIIENDKPRFVGVKELLAISTNNTVELLRKELEVKLAELEEDWHFTSLEKIFIEKKIYRDIENCETWEAVLEAIDKGLKKYRKLFQRDITKEDLIRLTEIKIKRISKFDSFKADEVIRNIEKEIAKVKKDLSKLVDYTIAYFKRIKEKYGKGRERKTEIRNFDVIEAWKVAAANEKLYVNRAEGFAGTSLRKDEYVCDCSDLDDIIVFRSSGTFSVTKVSDKSFFGKDIIHIAVFNKNDERTTYNMVYQDGLKGNCMIKRFAVTGVTRDKEYDLTRGKEGSRVLYFTANPNGEAEIIAIYLKPKPKLKKLNFYFDFKDIAIKGRNSIGNILSRHPVKKIVLKGEGVSTLGGLEIWFDDMVQRLNADKKGKQLGVFDNDDKILTVYQSGMFKVSNYDLSQHFDDDLIFIEKFNPQTIISAVYFDGELQTYYVKRFSLEPTEKGGNFIGDHKDSKLIAISRALSPGLFVTYIPENKRQKTEEEINIAEFIGVKSYKARGKRMTTLIVNEIKLIEPEVTEIPKEQAIVEKPDINDDPEINDNDSDDESKDINFDKGKQIELDF